MKLLFTGGNVSDCSVAVELLSKINISDSVVLADKAYGTLDIRTHIENQNSLYCIPP